MYRRDEHDRLIIKLTDFEFARGPDDDDDCCGTVEYIAPEMSKKRQHGAQNISRDRADVWSAGGMLYAAATKVLLSPSDALKYQRKAKTMTQCEINEELFKKTKGSLKRLLRKMIVRDVSKRKSFTDLLHQDECVMKGLQLLQKEQHPILKLCPEHVMPHQRSTSA